MRELGLREWTALAALAFGAVLGFLFLDPATGGGEAPPTTIELGRPPAPATPTPVPVGAMPAPDAWDVRFFVIRDGEEQAEAGRIVPVLDLAFEQAPFPDYRDNSWRVVAIADVTLPEGASEFTVRYDAALRVFIDDREIANHGEPPGPTDLIFSFEHDAGRHTIRLEATDESGPFLLQYR